MKLTKIFGIVLSLHVVVILLVMFQPGCQTVEKQPPATSENPPVKPAFNEGLSNPGTAEPEKASAADSGLSSSDPPGTGGNHRSGIGAPIVPAPVPVIVDPGPHQPSSDGVTVYKVQRGDTLWAIARRTTLRLLNCSRAIPPWTKIRDLRLVGRSFCPPEVLPCRPPRHQSLLRFRFPADGSSYVVQGGDTLSRIAGVQRVGLNSLMQANGLTKNSIIRPGQVLIIPSASGAPSVPSPSPTVVPEGSITHVVKKRENLTRISALYGTSVKNIMEWNNLSDAGRISIGQNLIVSDPTTAPSPAPPAEPGSPGRTPACGISSRTRWKKDRS